MDNKLKATGAPAYAKVSDTAVTNANNNIIAGTAGAGRAAAQKMGGRGMSAGEASKPADRAQNSATIKGYVAQQRMTWLLLRPTKRLILLTTTCGQTVLWPVTVFADLSWLDQGMIGQTGEVTAMSGQNFVRSASIGLDKPLLKHLM